MVDDAIFLLSGGALTPMVETPYDNEAILQKALEEYPALLAGSATGGDAGNLLLVRREMPVGDSAGVQSMSLDHLFLDSSGVPVLVEVKRSSDTRARREVVAQMLDYAANGVAYWPVERLRTFVEEAAAKDGGDASTVLQESLGVEDPDRYWRTVEDNLRAGRVRLIFLADRLTPGLVRIIEFLNEKMRDTEVLGIELPQFRSDAGAVVYVPRVVGRTTVAINEKGGNTGQKWNRERLMSAAQEVCQPAEVSLINSLMVDVTLRKGRFSWGTGTTAGVTGWYPVDGVDTPVWNVNIGAAPGRGHFYFIFGEFATRHQPPRIESYAHRVAGIDGLAARVEAMRNNDWKGWASLPLTEAASVQSEVLDAILIATHSDISSDAPVATP